MSRQHNSVITQTIKESYCGNRVFSESVNSKSAELSQMFKYTTKQPLIQCEYLKKKSMKTCPKNCWERILCLQSKAAKIQ